ncbi:MAG: HNH endonuclease signature motif containing protein, partial [Candidatus Eremiobacterota bacterium]
TFWLTLTQAELWEKTVDLACKVAGAELSREEVVEMLAVEFLQTFPASDDHKEVRVPDRRRLPRQHEREAEMEERYRYYDFLDDRPRPLEVVEREIPSDAEGKEALALELLETVRVLNVAVGRLLWHLSVVYRTPAFASLTHYAEERLGMTGSTARQFVAREERMRRDPALRGLVLSGDLSLGKLDLLLPLLDRGVDAKTWASFAAHSTCLNLKAWSRALRSVAETSPEAFEEFKRLAPIPGERPQDAHVRGRTLRLRRRVREAGLRYLAFMASWWWMGPVVRDAAAVSTLLPQAGMTALLFGTLECQMLSREGPESLALRVWLTPEVYRLVVRAESAVERLAGEPLDSGDRLQCLMRAYELAHADCGFTGQRKRLLEREDFQCAVPGCSCRKDLQAHHIVFRSDGGGNEDENHLHLQRLPRPGAPGLSGDSGQGTPPGELSAKER